MKLRTTDHAPATPAELTPRTRQKCVVVASPDVEYWEAVTLWSRTNGAVNALESRLNATRDVLNRLPPANDEATP